jgi:hypothetical protein
MSHQIRFHKAGLGLIPLLEGADGNLLLEERSRSSRGETTLTKFALRGQQVIRGCCAHGEQLAAALFCELEVLMPLQGFDECGEKGHESFGTDPVSCVPDQEQRVFDLWPILSRTRALKCLLHLFCMVEEPPRVCTMVSSRCNEGIQQRPFL